MTDLTIVEFTGNTIGRVEAKKVIKGIPKDIEQLVVIGQTEDREFYFASTDDTSTTNLMIDMAKAQLMDMCWEAEE